MSGMPAISSIQAPKGTKLGDIQAAGAGGGLVGSHAVGELWDKTKNLGGDIVDFASDAGHKAYNDFTGQTDRDFNEAEAEKLREWQEHMDSTKVQRGAADLAAAGINPLMAGQYSGGTPGGASASHSGSRSFLAGGLKGAIESMVSLAQAKNLASTADLHSAEASRVRQETGFGADIHPWRLKNESASFNLTTAQGLLAIQEKENKIASGRLTNAQVATEKKKISEIASRIGLNDSLSRLHGSQQQHSALGLEKAKEEARFYGTNAGKSSIWGDHSSSIIKGTPFRMAHENAKRTIRKNDPLYRWDVQNSSKSRKGGKK